MNRIAMRKSLAVIFGVLVVFLAGSVASADVIGLNFKAPPKKKIVDPIAPIKSYLTITEIMYNPASNSDRNWEYIEIYNTSTSKTLDLAGYVFDDDDGKTLSSANIFAGSIAPQSTAVLFNAKNNKQPHPKIQDRHDISIPVPVAAGSNALAQMQAAWGPEINFVAVSNWSALNNSGDHFGLWDSFAAYDSRNFANAIINVNYDDDDDWPGDDNKSSIYLTDLSADPNVGTNWILSSIGDDSGGWESNPAGICNKTNIGSPGSPPPAPVPEPVTLVLLGLGGLGILFRHKLYEQA